MKECDCGKVMHRMGTFSSLRAYGKRTVLVTTTCYRCLSCGLLFYTEAEETIRKIKA